MITPLGRLDAAITLSRAPERRKGWEELTAIGMDDLELARLNQANSREPVAAISEGARLVYGLTRRV